MPNGVKYSTTTPSGSLRRDNVALGVSGSLGPTANTGFYSMPTPSNGKYIINKVSPSSIPLFFAPQNDSELIRFARNEGATGANTGSAAAVLAWIATQPNLEAANFEYPNIVTDGLVLNLDAGFVGSYPTIGTTIYDISGNNNNGTLINGTSFDTTNGGALVFDGVDDYVQFTSTYAGTICFWGIMDANIPGLGALVGVTATGDGALRQESLSFRGTIGSPYFWDGGDGNDYQNGFPSQFMINGTSSLSTGGNGVFVIPNGRRLTQNFYVGAIGNRNVSTLSHTFMGRVYKGKIFNVMIYNRQLTNTELLQNYNAQKSRFGL